MNRDAVVYAHVGLFKQDVQLAVQNQIGISKRVVVDQIIQLLSLEAVIGNFVFNGGEVNGNPASIVKNQFYAGCVYVELIGYKFAHGHTSKMFFEVSQAVNSG